jgi:hypothetical protein
MSSEDGSDDDMPQLVHDEVSSDTSHSESDSDDKSQVSHCARYANSAGVKGVLVRLHLNHSPLQIPCFPSADLC